MTEFEFRIADIPYIGMLAKIENADIVLHRGQAHLMVGMKFGSCAHQALSCSPTYTKELMTALRVEMLHDVIGVACYALYDKPYRYNAPIVGLKQLEHDGDGVFTIIPTMGRSVLDR